MLHLVITVTKRSADRSSITGYREWTPADEAALDKAREYSYAERGDRDAAIKLTRLLLNDQRVSFQGRDNGWTIVGHNVQGAISMDGHVRVEQRLVENYAPENEDVAL